MLCLGCLLREALSWGLALQCYFTKTLHYCFPHLCQIKACAQKGVQYLVGVILGPQTSGGLEGESTAGCNRATGKKPRGSAEKSQVGARGFQLWRVEGDAEQAAGVFSHSDAPALSWVLITQQLRFHARSEINRVSQLKYSFNYLQVSAGQFPCPGGRAWARPDSPTSS